MWTIFFRCEPQIISLCALDAFCTAVNSQMLKNKLHNSATIVCRKLNCSANKSPTVMRENVVILSDVRCKFYKILPRHICTNMAVSRKESSKIDIFLYLSLYNAMQCCIAISAFGNYILFSDGSNGRVCLSPSKTKWKYWTFTVIDVSPYFNHVMLFHTWKE